MARSQKPQAPEPSSANLVFEAKLWLAAGNQSGEGDIRRALIEADLVDCMVALPRQLFYSTLDSANDARLFDGETELRMVA